MGENFLKKIEVELNICVRKNVYKLLVCSTRLVGNMYHNFYLSIFCVYSHLGWRSIYQWHSWNCLPAFKRTTVGPGTCGICLVPCYW